MSADTVSATAAAADQQPLPVKSAPAAPTETSAASSQQGDAAAGSSQQGDAAAKSEKNSQQSDEPSKNGVLSSSAKQDDKSVASPVADARDKPTTQTQPSPGSGSGSSSSTTRASSPTYEGPMNPASNLYVSNLPGSFTESQLKELFREFGTIVRCAVKNVGNPRAYGFVQFTTVADAHKAIEARNNHDIGGGQLLGVSIALSPRQKHHPYQRQYNNHRGGGGGQYYHHGHQQQQHHHHQQWNTGYAPTQQHAPQGGVGHHGGAPGGQEPPPTNLYVRGLPVEYRKQDLDDVFSKYGSIVQSRVVDLGVGFVRFDTNANALKAIDALDGTRPPNGSESDRLLVKFANPSPKYRRNKPQGGGGGGGGPASAPGRYSSSRYPQNGYYNFGQNGAPENHQNLYVRGLPNDITKQHLDSLFMQYGPLTSTKLIGNGVAFVRYDMPRNAQLAIQELNGRIVAGGSEPILVKLANSDPVKTFSPAAVSPHAAAAYGHAYGTPMYAGYAPHPHAAAAAAARYNAMSPVPGHPHAHHPHAHHPASPYAQHAAHLRHGLASPMHRVNSYPRYDAMGMPHGSASAPSSPHPTHHQHHQHAHAAAAAAAAAAHHHHAHAAAAAQQLRSASTPAGAQQTTAAAADGSSAAAAAGGVSVTSNGPARPLPSPGASPLGPHTRTSAYGQTAAAANSPVTTMFGSAPTTPAAGAWKNQYMPPMYNPYQFAAHTAAMQTAYGGAGAAATPLHATPAAAAGGATEKADGSNSSDEQAAVTGVAANLNGVAVAGVPPPIVAQPVPTYATPSISPEDLITNQLSSLAMSPTAAETDQRFTSLYPAGAGLYQTADYASGYATPSNTTQATTIVSFDFNQTTSHMQPHVQTSLAQQTANTVGGAGAVATSP